MFFCVIPNPIVSDTYPTPPHTFLGFATLFREGVGSKTTRVVVYLLGAYLTFDVRVSVLEGDGDGLLEPGAAEGGTVGPQKRRGRQVLPPY